MSSPESPTAPNFPINLTEKALEGRWWTLPFTIPTALAADIAGNAVATTIQYAPSVVGKAIEQGGKSIEGVIAGTRFALGKSLTFFGRGIEAVRAPIFDVLRKTSASAVNLVKNAAISPVLGAINMTRGAISGALGVLTLPPLTTNIPGLKWYGNLGNQALNWSSQTIKTGAEQLIKPVQLQTYANPLQVTANAAYEAGVAFPVGVTAAYAGLLNDTWHDDVWNVGSQFVESGRETTQAALGTSEDLAKWGAKTSIFKRSNA